VIVSNESDGLCDDDAAFFVNARIYKNGISVFCYRNSLLQACERLITANYDLFGGSV
jgi:hypothetical protein